ncbi:MAG: primosomal protein N', partial [Spirochaetaceae bacterium]|nr:primosomal protein N' [Spirochaetaceae bacterium]
MGHHGGRGFSVNRFIDVLLNLPVNRSFTYAVEGDTAEQAAVGKRVEVPFGSRRMTGFITALHDGLPPGTPAPGKIKNVRRVVDIEPIFTQGTVELARWVAEYYLCAIGEALSAMIPSGRRETGEGGFPLDDDLSGEQARMLSDEQDRIVHDITGTVGGKEGIHYVYGPTGTGKTEVFLYIAQAVLAAGKGVIYLVPEIGLTGQVIRAVTKRFGNTVAALHSGMTGSERLREWRRILRREARVVIGARSAVFAPVPDLGLIIIDEEHDGSYKSGSTPRYHARQVALRRYRGIAGEAAFPVVMGSATPSVEAWHLMNTSVITRHSLTRRLAGGKESAIEVVNLSKTGTASGCISPRLREEIDGALAEKRQTILFLNRRGYTHFFRCLTCGFEFKCKNCSVALTYHKAEGLLKCHYCGWTAAPPSTCPECNSLDVGYTGIGTEYIEQEVRDKFPAARIDRLDMDSVSRRGSLGEKLAAFRRGDVDILLGTQMVAKGLNFPHLRLVGIILADTGLQLPDFRAGERTFALITQVAGRAGRFFPDGRVIVQTFSPDRSAIALACRSDIAGFYAAELSERAELRFPPFARLLRLVFRATSHDRAWDAAAAART